MEFIKDEKEVAYKKTDTDILGLEVKDLTVHSDDRGDLYEVVHNYEMPRFAQSYIVKDFTRDTVRAFHKHEKLWDYFCIVHGRAKFVIVDDREDSDTYQNRETIVLDAGHPKMIVVPPGLHHGWQSLTDDTILLSTGSDLYDEEEPDEVRISPDSFGSEVWEQTKK